MATLGFLLVDKPKEISSFYIVKSLRKVLNVKRIGYAGTLDPLATGLMIVAVGEATKLLYALEQRDKTYEVKIRLGATSETYDAEGPIHFFENPTEPGPAAVKKVLEENFSGERTQIPPRYSAVKIAGKHAYDLVRKGKEVNIPAKKVVFHDIRILSYKYPVLECSVHCSAGTYIRSFAHDLGQLLGCGGYVEELRRVSIGRHSVENAVELQKITPGNFSEYVKSPESFLVDWQHCDVTSEELQLLQNGGFLENRWKVSESPALALYEGKTYGLLESCEGGKSVKFAKKFNLHEKG